MSGEMIGPEDVWQSLPLASVNCAALANAATGERPVPTVTWLNRRESFRAMADEGPAHLECDGEGLAIRWACGLAFRDPPPGSYRLRDTPPASFWAVRDHLVRARNAVEGER